MVKIVKRKGLDLRIHGRCTFFDVNNLQVGDYVRIGSNCFFFCKGGIQIGNNVQLSRSITIYSANHNYNGNAIPYDDSYIDKPVIIGDNVWIGMGAQILPGVTIGEGAIIGMGAIIYKNVQPYEIVVNKSMYNLKSRDISHYIDMKDKSRLFGKLYPDK
jgi:acetyltransferase-like isoleucine patch superfamily enzyme